MNNTPHKRSLDEILESLKQEDLRDKIRSWIPWIAIVAIVACACIIAWVVVGRQQEHALNEAQEQYTTALSLIDNGDTEKAKTILKILQKTPFKTVASITLAGLDHDSRNMIISDFSRLSATLAHLLNTGYAFVPFSTLPATKGPVTDNPWYGIEMMHSALWEYEKNGNLSAITAWKNVDSPHNMWLALFAWIGAAPALSS